MLQGYGRLRAAAYLVLADHRRRRGPGLAATAASRRHRRRRPAGGTRAQPGLHRRRGLTRLGLPADVVAGFSPEFLEGMTRPHRSRLLGDAGRRRARALGLGRPGGPEVDALLLVYAPDEAEGSLAYLRALAAGLRHRRAAGDRDPRHPRTSGSRALRLPRRPVTADDRRVGARRGQRCTPAAGELLLGYLNEHGQYARSPLVPARQDPRGRAPAGLPVPAGPRPRAARLADAHDFGRNGSYLVVRTLSQDVGAFWPYADAATRRPDGSPDPEARTHLAARLVGRWPSGAPLARSPDAGPPEHRRGKRLRLPRADEQGRVARSGRTSDGATPETRSAGPGHAGVRRRRQTAPAAQAGPAVRPASTSRPQLGRGRRPRDRRGLHFLALCADIARQFEFVSHTWVHNPHFAGLLDDADPLLGGHTGHGDAFTVQAEPVRRRHIGVPAFVTVKGGAYFFLPGVRTLQYLSREKAS